MDPELFKQIRLIAARNVKKVPQDYFERYLIRWYSRTYHTSIAEVMEIPTADILLAFYEERYAEYDPEDLQKEINELIETEAEKAARLQIEDEEELVLQRVIAAQMSNKDKKLADVIPEPKVKYAVPKEAELPISKPLKEGVEYKRVDDSGLEALLESIETLANLKKPKDGQS